MHIHICCPHGDADVGLQGLEDVPEEGTWTQLEMDPG